MIPFHHGYDSGLAAYNAAAAAAAAAHYGGGGGGGGDVVGPTGQGRNLKNAISTFSFLVSSCIF
jgi:hypothetical protein